MIRIHDFRDDHPDLLKLLGRGALPDPKVVAAVAEIVDSVRTRGDEALFHHMKRLDGIDLAAAGPRVPEAAIDAAYRATPPALIEAIDAACANLRRYHEKQLPADYRIDGPDGEVLERRYRPISTVGVCVPGATAPLLSSLYMNLIPALVAGVPRIVVISAPRDGRVDPTILATAAHLGVREVYAISGAQGVAALAYGTETVPKVDKIVGPGSIWVSTAKRLVYGVVGIDSLAGPSEIAIIADASADPRNIAIDLLSQAEHGTGEEASVAFVTTYAQAEAVRSELERLARKYDLVAAVKPALDRHGVIFVTSNPDDAVAAVNRLAPEHVELLGPEAEALADRLENYGALFLGEQTPEPVGDYYAGTNHVLPTQGTARFASGLTVADFLRSSSRVRYTPASLARAGDHIRALAEAEHMRAHGLAVEIRLRPES
ncbi:Histidinol dehydrogenase [Aquisphaera giovannonii]|uniref:Histidinol dehydrogenase n=1 Tax=Aquisphaera giovannonii TaxID=406548 RepID=A0A5B9WCN8_9BACT|nr:histidinol dehydrogenase [Aquisphaera giovannonii]QEH38034.1 Histidinol dehydrogenase [Aquisphaera giovannonii]